MNENLAQPDISLRLLQIFGAMMRCETTVEAVEQLGISQPAVSNGIRQLENQLGVTLFERLHRRLQPCNRQMRRLFFTTMCSRSSVWSVALPRAPAICVKDAPAICKLSLRRHWETQSLR